MAFFDWLVLAAYAALMLGVGAYYSRRNKSEADYLLGGRRMSPVVLGLSLFATLVSTLSYLSIPGEMIAHGPMMSLQFLAHPVIFLIVGYGLIPLIMRQPVMSAYELLEQRLGTSVRLAGAGAFLLMRLGWMAMILYATSKVVIVPLFALDAAWIPWLCIGVGALAAIYSATGGLKAVVVTDAIQSITMLAGAVVTIATITAKMGSVEAWWPAAWPQHWQSPSWGFDPEVRVSFGVLWISTIMWYVCTNGSDQMSIQRFLSTRNAAAARKTLAVSQVTDASVMILLGITGMAILGYYRTHAGSWSSTLNPAAGGDQFFPRFIMHEMPPGLAGLVLAAILSAALSSLSSGFNSTCAVLDRDFLSRRRRQRGEEMSVGRLKMLTWSVAVVAVALSLFNMLLTGNLIERCYKVVNLLTVPLFILFFLALFVRWANPVGAWLGLISSTLVAIAIAYDKELGLEHGISFVWMMPAALVTGIGVGMLGSLIGPRSQSADNQPNA